MRTLIVCICFLFHFTSAKCVEADTLVDIGAYKLHFHIIYGKNNPILFEAGGGNDATIWNELILPLSRATGATIITYDRAGFGQSGINTSDTEIDHHGLKSGIEALETGLKKLGFDKSIMLVAHSYGAFYATLYAARHPMLVKSVVLIDGCHVCFTTPSYVTKMLKELAKEIQEAKIKDPGMYYLFAGYPQTTQLMQSINFPSSIPVVDFVSDKTPFDDSVNITRWKYCHHEFANSHLNCTAITVAGSGHYIFKERPTLIIDTIITRYKRAFL